MVKLTESGELVWWQGSDGPAVVYNNVKAIVYSTETTMKLFLQDTEAPYGYYLLSSCADLLISLYSIAQQSALADGNIQKFFDDLLGEGKDDARDKQE